jgi:hypothetical protein
MIVLTIFLIFCFIGLGITVREVIINMIALDEIVANNKMLEKQLESHKKTVDEIKKVSDNISSSNELNKLKQNLKGMVK